MKKYFQLLSLALLMVFLNACSNDSDKNTGSLTGTVSFFHYVTRASTLSLESVSNDRGLGTVNFAQFGQSISLNVKTWDVTVTDLRDEADGLDDVPVLENADFTVVNNRRIINALIGDYVLDNIELVTLELGYDKYYGTTNDDDNDGIPDRRAQYITFSNILSTYPSVDIYLVQPADCSTALSVLAPQPTASVAFKSSSDNIRVEENITQYCLRITEPGTYTEIYNSGVKTLKDYIEQTVIVAPYTGAVATGSQITAFYFGDGKSEKWLASNSQGRVRVFNAIQDSTEIDFRLKNTLSGELMVDSNLPFKGLSAYELVNTQAVSYAVKPIDSIAGSSFFDGDAVQADVQDGQSYTVLFFGRVDSNHYATGRKILEDDNIYTNKASFTFINAGYVYDVDDREPYNIYVKTPRAGLGDSSNKVISNLLYGQYNEASLILNAPNTYEIWVMSADNFISMADTVTFNTKGGENFLFALIENDMGGTPFQVVQLAEASASETLITTAATATAGGPGALVTVQARDSSGNNLAIGGSLVTLTASSGSVTSVTDNADGTYTATVTDAVAETVTLSGTINGEAITDTAEIIFQP